MLSGILVICHYTDEWRSYWYCDDFGGESLHTVVCYLSWHHNLRAIEVQAKAGLGKVCPSRVLKLNISEERDGNLFIEALKIKQTLNALKDRTVQH